MPSLIGIDSGLTVTKAVIFDVDGTQLSVSRRRVLQSLPKPHHIERDMGGLWQATAEAIREALTLSGRAASDVLAIAATGHGDGLYLLDKSCQPLGASVLSLDSRAVDIIDQWSDGTVFEHALMLSGQLPHVSAPSTLLAWLREHEPERYARIAHVLSCKDWLRYCLSGTIGTDRTEASTSFTNVQTQSYSFEVMQLFGLERQFAALPPVAHSTDIAGYVTGHAATLTGLKAGTPVACGLHDVTASALGIDGHRDDVLSIVAGTYSINEVVATAPRLDTRWLCRNAIDAGRWNHMAISPASTANYDWFLDTLCHADKQKADADEHSIHDVIAAEIDSAMTRSSTLIFHPYLFGSPYGNEASGSFIGMRGWHDRGDLLKAVLEGIAFNHRSHIDALKESFDFQQVRLTGGGARNPAFVQMFADILDRQVLVTDTEEAAAFGAALCAGTAAGVYTSVHHGPHQSDASARIFQPVGTVRTSYDERFAVYEQIAESLKTQWPDIERLART